MSVKNEAMRREGDLSNIPENLKRLASNYLDNVLNYSIGRVSFDRFRKMTAQELSRVLCGEIIEIVFSGGGRGLLIDPDSYPEIYDSRGLRFQMRFKDEIFFQESGFNVISFSNLKKKAVPEFFDYRDWLIEHTYGNGGILALFLSGFDIDCIFEAAEKVAEKDGEPLYRSSLFPELKRGGGEKSGNRMCIGERVDIMREIASGIPVAEIARRSGVSRQTVYNLRKKLSAPFTQFFTGKTKKPRKSGRVSFEAYNDEIGYSASV